MTNRFPLTEAAIRDFPPPDRGRVYLHDTNTPHLQVCVTDRGARTYYYGRRIGGRPVRMRLGRVGEINLRAARQLTQELTGDVARGRDPHREKAAARQAPKLGDLWGWWEQHKVPTKKTGKRDRDYWLRFLEPWAGRALRSIDRRDVAQLIGRVAEEAPVTANRLLSLLRAMYNAADQIGYDGPNPSTKIKRLPEEARDRFLSPEEVRSFLLALQEEEQVWQDFFVVCLLTGARRGNVLSMRWADVNLENALWRLPAQDNKSGKVVVVPLVPHVVGLLQRRQQEVNGSPWVFPSRGKTGHIATPDHAWSRIVQRAGLQDVRIHDLRRTLGSWQAIAGTSLQVIGKSLGHTSISATQIYARLSMEPVRESVENVTGRMLSLIEEKEADDANR